MIAKTRIDYKAEPEQQCAATTLVLRASAALADNKAALASFLAKVSVETDASYRTAPIDVGFDITGIRCDEVLRQLQHLYNVAASAKFFNSISIIPCIQPARSAASESALVLLSAGVLSTELSYSLHTYVAMGGTFDRLHSGHRMLLTSSLLHTRDKLRIGITGQKLLPNKKHAHMMQSFSDRVEGAMQFVNKIRSDVEFETPELVEPSGGTDKIGEVTAMVVSPETLPSLDAINKVRADNGLEPMLPVMIEYVGGDASQRVSSTQLRKQAALAATSAASRAADTTTLAAVAEGPEAKAAAVSSIVGLVLHASTALAANEAALASFLAKAPVETDASARTAPIDIGLDITGIRCDEVLRQLHENRGFNGAHGRVRYFSAAGNGSTMSRHRRGSSTVSASSRASRPQVQQQPTRRWEC